MTISQHIGFGTCEHITNAKTATFVQSLIQVKRLHKKIGFNIQTVMMDVQFDPIKADDNNG